MKTVNAIPGRNSPVLNFADPLPNPLTDRFTTVNGKQRELSCSFPPPPPPPPLLAFLLLLPYPALPKGNIVLRAFPEKKNERDKEKPWGREVDPRVTISTLPELSQW